MSRLERVEIEGEIDVYLSLIRWGWTRRWSAGRKARRMGIGMAFVPTHELAVFRGHPNQTLPNMPGLVFVFRDKSEASDGYHKVAQALLAGGYWGGPVRALFGANQKEWLPEG